MRLTIDEFNMLVKQHFNFLSELGYRFLGTKNLNRDFGGYYQSKIILVVIRYSLTNRLITIITAYNNPNPEEFRVTYDNSLYFMLLFNKRSNEIYDQIMPYSVGEEKSFELVSDALKKYGLNILLGKERITTNDIIHRNRL